MKEVEHMPNGGADCCATCWFNRANGGKAGYGRWDDSISPHCVIRDLAIENPGYTYCANHQVCRNERDSVPIGPVLKNVTCARSIDEVPRNEPYEWRLHARYTWEPSPDSEEIRRHLLTLLKSMSEHSPRESNPYGPRLETVVVWQLGEFRERRAAGHLERIVEKKSGIWMWIPTDTVNEALAKIRDDP